MNIQEELGQKTKGYIICKQAVQFSLIILELESQIQDKEEVAAELKRGTSH